MNDYITRLARAAGELAPHHAQGLMDAMSVSQLRDVLGDLHVTRLDDQNYAAHQLALAALALWRASFAQGASRARYLREFDAALKRIPALGEAVATA